MGRSREGRGLGRIAEGRRFRVREGWDRREGWQVVLEWGGQARMKI